MSSEYAERIRMSRECIHPPVHLLHCVLWVRRGLRQAHALPAGRPGAPPRWGGADPI